MGGVLSSAKLVVEYHRTAGRQKDLQLGTSCAVCRNNHTQQSVVSEILQAEERAEKTRNKCHANTELSLLVKKMV